MIRAGSLTPEWLADTLPRPGPGGAYRIALSGGLDSSVLLDLAARMPRAPDVGLSAIHVDHQLNHQSGNWAESCRLACQTWGIDYTLERVHVESSSPEGLEAAARHARYRAFARCMQPGDVLITAHHADDQAETILLRLLRGSGFRGLAAMAPISDLPPGQLARPLLAFSQADLQRYAQRMKLHWIDDPSNRDERHDRNYLRHTVMPLLAARWPSVGTLLTRSAEHAREAVELMDDLAEKDFQYCINKKHLTIDCNKLIELEIGRRINLLQHWIRRLELPPMPGHRLEEAVRVMPESRPDASPWMGWDGGELRRYRGVLYAFPPLPAAPGGWHQLWDLSSILELPPGCGRLYLHAPGTQQATANSADNTLEVAFCKGGERILLPGHRHHKRLKTLWQQAGVPPWVRKRTPLLFSCGKLVAVADGWVTEDWLPLLKGEQQALHWERPQALNTLG